MRRLGVVGLVLVGLTCGGRPDQGREAPGAQGQAEHRLDPIGCWRLETTSGPGGPRPGIGLPVGLRLDSARYTGPRADSGPSTFFIARSLFADRVQDHPFGAWSRPGADSLWVGHPGAYAGVTIRAAGTGDTLLGRIQPHTDVRRPGQQPEPVVYAIRLVRTSCDRFASDVEGNP